jgi:flavin-dependent thymidylate synthase
MTVNLAGFNVDIENIKFLNGLIRNLPAISEEDAGFLKKLNWTPETISASYARISRDPRSIDELRSQARIEIEKARKSNDSIIYDMGHSSIAEHGVFNIDIVGISRLISEELEKSRLVSFTEKSQRYIRIGEDVHYPEEFRKDPDFFERYSSLVKDLFGTYDILLERLEKHFTAKFPVDNVKSSRYRDVVNLAKEDARYILPLSTLTQLGMTVNARNLEGILRKLSASAIGESKRLSTAIYEEIKHYAPSLVKYTEPSESLMKTRAEMASLADDLLKEIRPGNAAVNNDVTLCGYDPDMECKIIAGFILQSSSLDFQTAFDRAKSISKGDREDLLRCAVRYLKPYESLTREFELSNFEFAVRITATAFAQLKRHRMLTLIDGHYSPGLGIVVPPSIIETGMEKLFLEKIEGINGLYEEAKGKFGRSADYILSNSHMKNIVIKCNFRELTHITRLRSDPHAQWDIRGISDRMLKCVEEKFPFLSNLLGGKADFEDKINNILNDE